jgi:hypothetical protein
VCRPYGTRIAMAFEPWAYAPGYELASASRTRFCRTRLNVGASGMRVRSLRPQTALQQVPGFHEAEVAVYRSGTISVGRVVNKTINVVHIANYYRYST